MNKLFCAIAFILSSTAYADTVNFCSQTPASFTTGQTAKGYTSSINSATTLVPGECINPPPPVGCTTPPVIKSATTGVANYTRLVGLINVNYYGAGTHTSNIANFQSIYRTDFSVAETPFPGKASLTAVVSLNSGAASSNYLSEQINVPFGYVEGHTPRFGTFSLNQSSSNVPLGMTISKACGDFSNPGTYANSTVIPGCWRNRQQPATPGPLQWRKDTTCIIESGQTYYLNVIAADISTATPTNSTPVASTKNNGCGAASCAVAVNNVLGPLYP
jgi:hypothetical protein